MTDRALLTETIAPRPIVWRITVSFWLLGIGVFLCRGIISAYRLRRILRRCRPVADGNLTVLLESCRIQAGVRRPVELLFSDVELAPALAGIVTPRIIISQSSLAAFGPNEFRWLCRHELAHVRRHDVFLQRFWSLACTIHWFNPLVWWAASRAMFEAELACDELVIGDEPAAEQVGYARALVKTAELLMTPQALPGSVALTHPGAGALQESSRNCQLQTAAAANPADWSGNLALFGRCRIDRCGRAGRVTNNGRKRTWRSIVGHGRSAEGRRSS